MSKYFYCRGCKQRVGRSPCLKEGQQQYCSKRECQQARKNHWERQKKRLDPVYRQQRKEQHQVWLQNNTGHSYQTTYRKDHPDYAAKNRLHQQVRNLLLREVALGVNVRDIVKTDALFAVISVCQRVPGLLVADCKDGRD